MKKSNTSNRLKQLMDERNLKQIDILKLTLPYCEQYEVKMNKSDISQYVSGKVEPNQNKLFVLSIALNVNEAWLMGYDVPMERVEHNYLSDEEIGEVFYENMVQDVYKQMRAVFSKDEVVHFEDYVQLNLKNKRTVDKYTKQLLELQRMDDALYADAASKRTDINIPEDADTSENDIFDDNF